MKYKLKYIEERKKIANDEKNQSIQKWDIIDSDIFLGDREDDKERQNLSMVSDSKNFQNYSKFTDVEERRIANSVYSFDNRPNNIRLIK